MKQQTEAKGGMGMYTRKAPPTTMNHSSEMSPILELRKGQK